MPGPIAQSYRRVPNVIEDKVDQKIDKLAQGITEKVNEPSKWVSPMVLVLTGDDVHICIDMRRANEEVERENHSLTVLKCFCHI